MLTLGTRAGSNPGSSSPCKKEHSSYQVLEETWAILNQLSPWLSLKTPLHPCTATKKTVWNRSPTCCCAKGLREGVLSLERVEVCPDTARHMFGCCALTRGSTTAQDPLSSALSGSLYVQHCCGSVPEHPSVCTGYAPNTAIEKLLG